MGFKVRGSSNIDWFVLQLHYGDLPDNKDHLTGKISLNKLSLNIDILMMSRIRKWPRCTVD